MYCEYLIEDYNLCTTKEEKMQVAAELYIANYNLLHTLSRVFHVTDAERDDYYQLCFLANLDALVAYRHGLNSFLSYYRRCILHRLYLYRLEFVYPFRVKSKSFKAVSSMEFVDDSGLASYGELDSAYSKIEEAVSADSVWGIVRQTVRPIEYKILQLHFCEGRTYDWIGRLLGFKETQIKTKKNNAFRKLKRCRELRIIASSIYEINIM